MYPILLIAFYSHLSFHISLWSNCSWQLKCATHFLPFNLNGDLSWEGIRKDKFKFLQVFQDLMFNKGTIPPHLQYNDWHLSYSLDQVIKSEPIPVPLHWNVFPGYGILMPPPSLPKPAFPQRDYWMLLSSCVILNMSFFGMVLKFAGSIWDVWKPRVQKTTIPTLDQVLLCRPLQDSAAPPEIKPCSKTGLRKAKAACKKPLAKLLFALTCLGTATPIESRSERAFRTDTLCQHRCCKGILQSNGLNSVELSQLHHRIKSTSDQIAMVAESSINICACHCGHWSQLLYSKFIPVC